MCLRATRHKHAHKPRTCTAAVLCPPRVLRPPSAYSFRYEVYFAAGGASRLRSMVLLTAVSELSAVFIKVWKYPGDGHRADLRRPRVGRVSGTVTGAVRTLVYGWLVWVLTSLSSLFSCAVSSTVAPSSFLCTPTSVRLVTGSRTSPFARRSLERRQPSHHQLPHRPRGLSRKC